MADSKPLISTFVFTKIHTTGRKWDKQSMDIIEICMSAILREYIETDKLQPEEIMFMKLVKPVAPISLEAANATQLDFSVLEDEPIFEEIVDEMINYLNGLPKPVCMVAHNGNSFDFKVLHNETDSIKKMLPEDLLVADFKWIFYDLLKKESDVKIGQSLVAMATKLDVEFAGTGPAEDWVRTMIACVMKRKMEFLKRADGKYSKPIRIAEN